MASACGGSLALMDAGKRISLKTTKAYLDNIDLISNKI